MATHQDILELSVRLADRARAAEREQRPGLAADLRSAALIAHRYAALMLADEALVERNPARRQALTEAAASAWRGRTP
jgi:hypothetical protein